MEELPYYLDTDHNALSVYEKKTEFFADFVAGEWVMSRISFMQFRHDCNYRRVSCEEAAAMTGGTLPGGAVPRISGHSAR